MAARPEDAKQGAQVLQFLGLAFAGADLLFEVDGSGVITFAIGAAAHITGIDSADLINKRWAKLVSPADGGFLATVLHDLAPGERRGPLQIELAASEKTPRRAAAISLFRLPQNTGRTSCALSLVNANANQAPARNRHGLVKPEGFEKAAADALHQAADAGVAVQLAMLEVPGLAAAVKAMDTAKADETMGALGALLRAQSYGSMGGAEMAPDRFAVVAAQPLSVDQISGRLTEASGCDLHAATSQVAIAEGAPVQQLKALRYILDRYIKEGGAAAASDFTTLFANLERQSAGFRSALASNAFTLAYQPIVSLGREQLHHYEALTRFDGNSSPAQTIQLAEELGLVVDFDLAVVRQVIAVLSKAPSSTKIAVNISGLSLTAPTFVDALGRMVSNSVVSPARLLLEVTETAKINDVNMARNAIVALRKRGHAVCMDDFGAGAASIEYVAEFEFDFIKIDGRYVKALSSGGREAVLLKHMAALCRDLGVTAIAEMVESREVAQELASLGVPLGQGWAFGKPQAELNWARSPMPGQSAARRVGAVEGWG